MAVPAVVESHSDDKDSDRHWDSGVGSSSERTSIFSVSDGIRLVKHNVK